MLLPTLNKNLFIAIFLKKNQIINIKNILQNVFLVLVTNIKIVKANTSF